MIYYAIRQMSTGYFMPQSKRRKGFTWDEPVKDCVPRLFKRVCDAKRALNCWLDGGTESRRFGGSYLSLMTMICTQRVVEYISLKIWR